MGRVGDLIGGKRTLILGFLLLSIALTWLVPARAVWMLFVIAGIFGFAYGACAVSHSPLLAELFGLKSHGLIFGAFNLSVQVGGAIGPLLTGYVFDLAKSYQFAFFVSVAVSLMGLILTAFLPADSSAGSISLASVTRTPRSASKFSLL